MAAAASSRSLKERSPGKGRGSADDCGETVSFARAGAEFDVKLYDVQSLSRCQSLRGPDEKAVGLVREPCLTGRAVVSPEGSVQELRSLSRTCWA